MLKNLLVHIPSERPMRAVIDAAISLAASRSAHLDAISCGYETANVGLAIEAGGAAVGKVTSGTHSPSLERPIGIGYVPAALAKNGTPLAIRAGAATLEAVVTPRPFYTHGSRH
jgi:glycine cleavage system aminomethyltransferase T